MGKRPASCPWSRSRQGKSLRVSQHEQYVQQERCLQRYQSTHAWNAFGSRLASLLQFVNFCWGSFGLSTLNIYTYNLVRRHVCITKHDWHENPNIYLYQYHHVRTFCTCLKQTKTSMNSLEPGTGGSAERDCCGWEGFHHLCALVFQIWRSYIWEVFVQQAQGYLRYNDSTWTICYQHTLRSQVNCHLLCSCIPLCRLSALCGESDNPWPITHGGQKPKSKDQN